MKTKVKTLAMVLIAAQIIACNSPKQETEVKEEVKSYDQIKKSFEERSNNSDNFAFTPAEVKVTNLDRQTILNLLSAMPITIEELYQESELSLEVVYMICLEFELAGKITRHVGNKISLIL